MHFECDYFQSNSFEIFKLAVFQVSPSITSIRFGLIWFDYSLYVFISFFNAINHLICIKMTEVFLFFPLNNEIAGSGCQEEISPNFSSKESEKKSLFTLSRVSLFQLVTSISCEIMCIFLFVSPVEFVHIIGSVQSLSTQPQE